MSAFERQVGGSHYKHLKIEPVPYAMANGYDACAFNIAKYIMRHEKKHGLLDLDKALHYIEMRLEQPVPVATRCTISVEDVCQANGYERSGSVSKALLALHILMGCQDQADRVYQSSVLRARVVEIYEEYKARDGESQPLPHGPCPVDVSFTGDQDKRQDVVGQNGNGGEHYERS